jgi:hypothetical protein
VFLEGFDAVKKTVMNNPWMLYKDWWR